MDLSLLGLRAALCIRAYGAFPRIFGHYVRGQGLMRLEEAVRKATSLPTQLLGIRERGLLREGFFAGVDYVIVNGKIVFEKGKITDARAGRVVRGRGARPTQ